jgi:heme/copper-type cytochrome/quinol oxidase subunit 3
VIQDGRPRPAVPSAVLGMLIFIFTELMFFAGMISAFSIARAGSVVGWPPPGQPRLPFEETALNTAALLASGAVLVFTQRVFRRERRRARLPFAVAIALGAFFVVFQGVEWAQLLGQGLTLTSSLHGSFFYLLIGTHAVHAIGALLALGWAFDRLRRGVLHQSTFAAVQAFWYFVVGVWPVLYLQVYR